MESLSICGPTRSLDASRAFFGLAGAAEWGLDQPEEAVELWKAGSNCNYGDAGGASVGNHLSLNLELDMPEGKPVVESRRALVKFFESLLDFDIGVLSKRWVEGTEDEIADTSGPQCIEQDVFTYLIRHAEFYIARHEAER